MDYQRGDIITKKSIVFKDTNKIDTRIGGHPCVIPIDILFEDDNLYYLTITSQIQHYVKNPDKYYLLKKDKYNKLKKPSIVDLKNIYKDDNKVILCTGTLKDYDYKELVNKLIEYQDKNPDENYKEIVEQLREYVPAVNE